MTNFHMGLLYLFLLVDFPLLLSSLISYPPILCYTPLPRLVSLLAHCFVVFLTPPLKPLFPSLIGPLPVS